MHTKMTKEDKKELDLLIEEYKEIRDKKNKLNYQIQQKIKNKSVRFGDRIHVIKYISLSGELLLQTQMIKVRGRGLVSNYECRAYGAMEL